MARKDGSTVENVNIHVQDDTAEATLGLWGASTLTPLHTTPASDKNTDPETTVSSEGWKAGETVLLLQAPGWKIGRSVSTQDKKINCDTHLMSSDVS